MGTVMLRPGVTDPVFAPKGSNRGVPCVASVRGAGGRKGTAASVTGGLAGHLALTAAMPRAPTAAVHHGRCTLCARACVAIYRLVQHVPYLCDRLIVFVPGGLEGDCMLSIS